MTPLKDGKYRIVIQQSMDGSVWSWDLYYGRVHGPSRLNSGWRRTQEEAIAASRASRQLHREAARIAAEEAARVRASRLIIEDDE